ncbi:hypothetical protein [Citreimonas salinaria]|uniref:Uncharacterized protein n=1 Tax=Citreimonas salinaria TaxID=321339 RepID=A0A1H3KTP4_9RHOB|nr:hypothetical protein [Citreimonas salinaria]SDY55542.1 hypothetical protein SAMN05444340_110104 [Citreimonas salinaria]
MIAEWPTELPRPLRRNYGAQTQDGRRRRATEAGPPRFARRYSSVARRLDLAVVLDRERWGILNHFFTETLAGGSLPFWMPDPWLDGTPLLDESGAPLLDDAGTPLLIAAQLLCLWGDEPPLEGPVQGVSITVAFSVWDMP